MKTTRSKVRQWPRIVRPVCSYVSMCLCVCVVDGCLEGLFVVLLLEFICMLIEIIDREQAR